MGPRPGRCRRTGSRPTQSRRVRPARRTLPREAGFAAGGARARPLQQRSAGRARGVKRQSSPLATAGGRPSLATTAIAPSSSPGVQAEPADASNNGAVRGISSAGRALQSHCRGQGFESPILHWHASIGPPGLVTYQARGDATAAPVWTPKRQDRESKRGGQHGGSCTDSNALPAP